MKWTIAIAVSLMPAVAVGEDLPARKPGQWEILITNSQTGGQATKMQQCIDAATDAKLMKMGSDMSARAGSSCDTVAPKREGDKYIGSAVCKMMGSTINSKSEFSGDFQSAYEGLVTATYEPPIMGMKETTTKISARYLGACPADQKPGDLVMPGGRKVNINDLQRLGAQMGSSAHP